MRVILPCTPPYDWVAMSQFLAARATPGVERVDAAGYSRSISVNGFTGSIAVAPMIGADALTVDVSIPDRALIPSIVERVAAMFDVDHDPATVAEVFGRLRLFKRACAAHAGIRLPGAWDPFELSVRAILGQQISVRAATTMAGRVAAKWGEAVTTEHGVDRLFPWPAALVDAKLERIGLIASLVLGVQGRDIDEMLGYVERAEALAPDAVIAMPPTSAATLDDYRRYFRALAGAAHRPVILQTSGGARNLVPPVEMIVGLAREFSNCGYVKEESAPVLDRMREEVRQRPPMRGIFGASFGVGWLYEMRLGLDGVITGNAMYADLMARMWDLHTRGKRDDLRDAYSKFLLMRNLDEQVAGTSLFVMKKRGIFKTTVTRAAAPLPGQPPKVTQVALPADAIQEIEYRLAALEPYLMKGL
jgi:dihydrodipicolinate synthase/N-acetylneuraminate lyase